MSPARRSGPTFVSREPGWRTTVVVSVEGRTVLQGELQAEHGDLCSLDVLMRLRVALARAGFGFHLEDPCPVLIELAQLVGLGEVLAGATWQGRPLAEVLGQTEGAEQLKFDEVVDGGDPVA